MREQIRLDVATKTRGADGSDIETWAELATVWAEVLYAVKTSDEKTDAGKLVAMAEVVFRIRKRTDVTELNRVYYGSRYYNIQAIEITPDQQFMILAGKGLNL